MLRELEPKVLDACAMPLRAYRLRPTSLGIQINKLRPTGLGIQITSALVNDSEIAMSWNIPSLRCFKIICKTFCFGQSNLDILCVKDTVEGILQFSRPGYKARSRHGERVEEGKRYSDGAHARCNVLFVNF